MTSKAFISLSQNIISYSISLTGYSIKEIRNVNLLELIHPDDRINFKNTVDELFKHPLKHINFNYRFKHKLGNYILIEGVSLKNNSTTPISDSSSLQENEDKLKISEANLSTILNHSDTAYILISPTLSIISFNDLAQNVFTTQTDHSLILGKSILDYYKPDKQPTIKEFMLRAINGENTTYEIKLLQNNGHNYWFSMSYIGILDPERNNHGLILAINDITDKKLAEIDRNRITADLAERIKSLEQFSYIVSHNLRAPVASIMGLSYLFNDKEIREDNSEELYIALDKTINDLNEVTVDLNRILQVKQHRSEQVVDVNLSELIQEIKILLSHLIVNDDVKIECDFKINIIQSLHSYLHSIFYNLILNAIKFRKPRISTIIKIASQLENGFIKLTILDNGKGIDLIKNADSIFGLYNRFDTSIEGKGMGLFMVKTQVEILKGKIQVKSKINSGTEFIIRLPTSLKNL